MNVKKYYIHSRTKYLNSYRRENWEMIKAEISGSLLKEIETALNGLNNHKKTWAATSIANRLEILFEMQKHLPLTGRKRGNWAITSFVTEHETFLCGRWRICG